MTLSLKMVSGALKPLRSVAFGDLLLSPACLERRRAHFLEPCRLSTRAGWSASCARCLHHAPLIIIYQRANYEGRPRKR
jgi:hypothetical protein